jgi:hypothetical protein
MLLTEGDWRKLLSRYKIDEILLPGSMPLSRALTRDPDWAVDYRDDVAIVLAKRTKAPAANDRN